MMNLVRQHKGAASLVFANIGVAVSVLGGAVQFLSTYEQTQADVMALHEQMDQAVRHDQLDALRMQLDEATRDGPFQSARITRLEEQVAASTSTVDLDRIKGDLDALKERIVFVESQLNSVQGAEAELRDIDSRVDQLDDFVVRWDEQSSMIMAEHEQFSEIIAEVFQRLDDLDGERTRVQVPAGAKRGYGYD